MYVIIFQFINIYAERNKMTSKRIAQVKKGNYFLAVSIRSLSIKRREEKLFDRGRSSYDENPLIRLCSTSSD